MNKHGFFSECEECKKMIDAFFNDFITADEYKVLMDKHVANGNDSHPLVYSQN